VKVQLVSTEQASATTYRDANNHHDDHKQQAKKYFDTDGFTHSFSQHNPANDSGCDSTE
jgi:hypothetical protein